MEILASRETNDERFHSEIIRTA